MCFNLLNMSNIFNANDQFYKSLSNLLLQNGMRDVFDELNKDWPIADISKRLTSDNTTLMESMRHCNKKEGDQLIRLLLEKEFNNINLQSREGYTILMLAVKYANTQLGFEMVEFLLTIEGVDISILSYNHESIIMIAIELCNSSPQIGFKIINILLNLKTDCDLINIQTKTGDTALMRAIQCRTIGVEIITCLLYNNANVNIKNDNGETALTLSFANKTPYGQKIMELLLACEHLDINRKVGIKNGETILSRMILMPYMFNHTKQLLKKNNYVDINMIYGANDNLTLLNSVLHAYNNIRETEHRTQLFEIAKILLGKKALFIKDHTINVKIIHKLKDESKVSSECDLANHCDIVNYCNHILNQIKPKLMNPAPIKTQSIFKTLFGV